MAFISVLGLIGDETVAGFVGILMASVSASFYRDARPYCVDSSNQLANVANQQLAFSFLAATFVRSGHGTDATFGLFFVGANLSMFYVAIVASRADNSERARKQAELRSLYDSLKKLVLLQS